MSIRMVLGLSMEEARELLELLELEHDDCLANLEFEPTGEDLHHNVRRLELTARLIERIEARI